MDLSKVLNQLREELDHLNAAILSLESLQGETRRRGRPPKALSEINKSGRAGHKGSAEPEPVVEER